MIIHTTLLAALIGLLSLQVACGSERQGHARDASAQDPAVAADEHVLDGGSDAAARRVHTDAGDEPRSADSGAAGRASTTPRDSGAREDARAPSDCEPTTLARTHHLPKVRLVIDGSSMMTLPFDNTTLWEGLRSALFDARQGALRGLERKLAWGLTIYDGTLGDSTLPLPDGGLRPNPTEECLRTIDVAPKQSNVDQLQSAFPLLPPGGSSPTGRVLQALEAQLPFAGDAPNVVVLVSDGSPNDRCANSNSDEQARGDVRAALKRLHVKGVSSYVVSLAKGVSELEQHVGEFAVAGGTGQHAYRAKTVAELAAAFKDIGERMIERCEIPLDGRLQAKDTCNARLELNGDAVACGGDDGWQRADAYTLRLTGAACENYLSADEQTLKVQLPCDVFTALTPDGHCQDSGRCGCESTALGGRWDSAGPTSLVVVFDRSASMLAEYQGTTRGALGISALETALSQRIPELSVGGLFYPSEPPQACPCDQNNPNHWIPGPEACCLAETQTVCSVNPLGSPDQIGIGSTTSYLGALRERVQQSPTNGGSPLSLAFQYAGDALSALPVEERLALIVVSDGQADCSTDPDAAAKVLEGMQRWNSARVPSYVIGWASDTTTQMQLDALAAAGGTDRVWTQANAAQLGQVLARRAEITRGRCHYSFDQPVNRRFLHLVVRRDGQEYEVMQGMGERGYDVGPSDAALSDALCADVLEGRVSDLQFKDGCVELPRLP